ncbi:MAG TPA: hypothetical protein VF881_03435 [Polyangiaceae bacterium]
MTRASHPLVTGAAPRRVRVPPPVGPWTRVTIPAALVGPPVLVVSNRFFGEVPPLHTQVVLQLFYCVFAASIIWVVVRRERLPLRPIGVRRPTWSTFVGAILVALVTLYFGQNDLLAQTRQPPRGTRGHMHGMPLLVLGTGTMRHACPRSVRLSTSAFALTSMWRMLC